MDVVWDNHNKHPYFHYCPKGGRMIRIWVMAKKGKRCRAHTELQALALMKAGWMIVEEII